MRGFEPARIETDQAAIEMFEGMKISDSLEIACKYTGGGKVVFSLGRSAAGPFAFAKDSNGRHSLMIDSDEKRLFSAVANAILEYQSSVNSDPRSPEYFSPEIECEEFAKQILERFDVAIELIY